MPHGRTSRTAPGTLRTGALMLAALIPGLLLVNRFLFGRAWDESLLQALLFAVPFTIVYTALSRWMQRRREDGAAR